MIERLLFRVDKLTGNCSLRKGAVVLGALLIGILLWLSVETQSGRSQKPSGQIDIETQTISRAAERQIQVNPEVRALVFETDERGTLDGLPYALGKQASAARTPPSSGPPEEARNPAPPPRFRREEQVPSVKSRESGKESVIQPVDCSRAETGAPEAEQTPDRSVGVLQTASILARGAPSAVAFKRAEDRDIQKRDSLAFSNRPGISAGTVVRAELLTGIISGDSVPVVVAVREDVIFGGTVAIPAGSTFIGTAQANYDSRRLFVNLNRLVIGNTELPAKGQILDARGRSGLCDRYVDAGAQQLWPAFFAGLLGEFGRAFSSRTAGTGLSGQKTNVTIPDQVQIAVLAGTGSGLDAVSQMLVERAKQAKAVILAYPGQTVSIVIDEMIPLERLLQAKGRG